MRRNYTILIFLLLPFGGFCQISEPFLRLNTEMHTAKIGSIDVDASERFILTCSIDKTAKLWDSNSGELVQTFYPPINRGNNGMLYSGAISPDGDIVAVSGFTGNEGEKMAVYIFDIASGEIINVIGGLPNVVHDIKFSTSGKHLGIALSSQGIRVYYTSTFELYKSDSEYKDRAVSLDFDSKGRMVTASYDGHLRLYNSYFNLEKKIKTKGGKQPEKIDFSPDGEKIAINFNDTTTIQIFDGSSLELLYEPDVSEKKSKRKFTEVCFSSKNNELIGGGNKIIRIWNEAGQGTHRDVNVSKGLITDLKSLSDGQLMFCSLHPDWGISNEGKLLLHKKSEGNNPNSLALGITNFGFEILNVSKEQIYFFNLKNRKVSSRGNVDPQGFSTNKRDSLEITGLGKIDSLKLNGKKLGFLKKLENSTCVDISLTNKQITIGTIWNLYCIDNSGKELWKVTTQSSVYNVNISQDGKLAVARLADGTIRWYSMADGELLLSLFIHSDKKRWIVWTPKGYYDAAPGAEKFLGWHLNQGNDKAAIFYEASKFREKYYRPDIIDKIVETLDVRKAIKSANKTAGKYEIDHLEMTKELPPIVKILNPTTGSSISENTVEVEYSIKSPNNEPITEIKAFLNGRQVTYKIGRGVKPLGKRGSLKIKIPSEDCTINLLAKNRFGSGDANPIKLKWVGAAPTKSSIVEPNLYILAIGVSEYKKENLKLNFAAKDAGDFYQIIKKQEGLFYNSVSTKVLKDDDANRNDILDGLEWIVEKTTQNDIAMIFFAGHGAKSTHGTFYLVPFEGDFDNKTLRRNGISKAEIKETVKTIAGKVLVFIDACNSGGVMTETRRDGASGLNSLIAELSDSENGAIVFSSSLEGQASYEDSKWKNGAFTKALIEGVKGKAAFEESNEITWKNLDAYITNRVKRLTDGKQSPTTDHPPGIGDFVIGFKPKK